MNLDARIEALGYLGDQIREKEEFLQASIRKAQFENPWFTHDFIDYQLTQIAEYFLDRHLLKEWIDKYPIGQSQPKRIAIIMAGNLPLVGFQDFLCTFLSGHQMLLKYSEKDKSLFPALIRILKLFSEECVEYIEVVSKIENFDAVIATGSNNTNRYFEYYFRKHPKILRKSRSSVAVLSSETTAHELDLLMDDIFLFFGLGCRSVSKLYLPQDFNLDRLFEASNTYKSLAQHPKYSNNYKYNLAGYLLNKEPFLTNDLFLLQANTSLVSRIACLHYEYYSDVADVKRFLLTSRDDLQCVVSNVDLNLDFQVPLGQSQKPNLTDYPDGIDVMEFLLNL